VILLYVYNFKVQTLHFCVVTHNHQLFTETVLLAAVIVGCLSRANFS